MPLIFADGKVVFSEDTEDLYDRDGERENDEHNDRISADNPFILSDESPQVFRKTRLSNLLSYFKRKEESPDEELSEILYIGERYMSLAEHQKKLAAQKDLDPNLPLKLKSIKWKAMAAAAIIVSVGSLGAAGGYIYNRHKTSNNEQDEPENTPTNDVFSKSNNDVTSAIFTKGSAVTEDSLDNNTTIDDEDIDIDTFNEVEQEQMIAILNWISFIDSPKRNRRSIKNKKSNMLTHKNEWAKDITGGCSNKKFIKRLKRYVESFIKIKPEINEVDLMKSMAVMIITSFSVTNKIQKKIILNDVFIALNNIELKLRLDGDNFNMDSIFEFHKNGYQLINDISKSMKLEKEHIDKFQEMDQLMNMGEYKAKLTNIISPLHIAGSDNFIMSIIVMRYIEESYNLQEAKNKLSNYIYILKEQRNKLITARVLSKKTNSANEVKNFISYLTHLSNMAISHLRLLNLLADEDYKKARNYDLKNNYLDINYAAELAEAIISRTSKHFTQAEAKGLESIIFNLMKTKCFTFDMYGIMNDYDQTAKNENPFKNYVEETKPEGYYSIQDFKKSNELQSQYEFNEQFYIYRDKFSKYDSERVVLTRVASEEINMEDLVGDPKYVNVYAFAAYSDELVGQTVVPGRMVVAKLESNDYFIISNLGGKIVCKILKNSEAGKYFKIPETAQYKISPYMQGFHEIPSKFQQYAGLDDNQRIGVSQDFLEPLYGGNFTGTGLENYRPFTFRVIIDPDENKIEMKKGEGLLPPLTKGFNHALNNYVEALHQSYDIKGQTQIIAEALVPLYSEFYGMATDSEHEIDFSSVVLDAISVTIIVSQLLSSVMKITRSLAKTIETSVEINKMAGLGGRFLFKQVMIDIAPHLRKSAINISQKVLMSIYDALEPVPIKDAILGLYGLVDLDKMGGEVARLNKKWRAHNIKVDQFNSADYVESEGIFTKMDDKKNIQSYIVSEGGFYPVRKVKNEDDLFSWYIKKDEEDIPVYKIGNEWVTQSAPDIPSFIREMNKVPVIHKRLMTSMIRSTKKAIAENDIFRATDMVNNLMETLKSKKNRDINTVMNIYDDYFLRFTGYDLGGIRKLTKDNLSEVYLELCELTGGDIKRISLFFDNLKKVAHDFVTDVNKNNKLSASARSFEEVIKNEITLNKLMMKGKRSFVIFLNHVNPILKSTYKLMKCFDGSNPKKARDVYEATKNQYLAKRNNNHNKHKLADNNKVNHLLYLNLSKKDKSNYIEDNIYQINYEAQIEIMNVFLETLLGDDYEKLSSVDMKNMWVLKVENLVKESPELSDKEKRDFSKYIMDLLEDMSKNSENQGIKKLYGALSTSSNSELNRP